MKAETIVTRKFNGELDVAEGVIRSLPDHLLEDFSAHDKGPCLPADHYFVLQTNTIGELQIHVCGQTFMGLMMVGCCAAFFYSPVYGWLKVHENNPLWARIVALRDLAAATSSQAKN